LNNSREKFGDVSLALNYIFDESTGTLTPAIGDEENICVTSSARLASRAEKSSFIGIFPNPAADQITLQYDLTSYSKAKMMIFDMDGKTLYQTVLDTKDFSIDLNVVSLRNGVYLIKIISEGELIKVEKLTIVK
jgi:hypothetical protein